METTEQQKETVEQQPKETIVEINRLYRQFGDHLILDDINLKLYKGEVFGIIGISGGGKTTLLKIMVGFLLPSSGVVLFRKDGILRSVHKHTNDVKRTFGFAAQEPSFYLQLKVLENLHHFGSLHDVPKETREFNAERFLKLVNLYDFRNALAVKLSGGMRRRLGLLTSTVHDPSILALDEPTADLDPYSRKQIIKFIMNAKQEGKTVIVSSHLLDDIETLCDRVAIMHKGKIIKMGTPNDLREFYSMHKEIKIETRSRKYDKLIEYLKSRKFSITKIEQEGRKLVIKSPDVEGLLATLLNLIKKNHEEIVDINVLKPSLNEVFDTIFGEKEGLA